MAGAPHTSHAGSLPYRKSHVGVDAGGGEGYMFSLNRSPKWKFRIEGLAPGARYVMGSSHTITPTVKPENFVAIVEATLKYGAY